MQKNLSARVPAQPISPCILSTSVSKTITIAFISKVLSGSCSLDNDKDKTSKQETRNYHNKNIVHTNNNPQACTVTQNKQKHISVYYLPHRQLPPIMPTMPTVPPWHCCPQRFLTRGVGGGYPGRGMSPPTPPPPQPQSLPSTHD